MMIQEFEKLTGLTVTPVEYDTIEQMYYEFDGDKQAFCKKFMKDNGIIEVLRLIAAGLEAEKFEALSNLQIANEKIARLEANLDRELEWRPYEDTHNVSQNDYDTLANDRDTQELTDEEAADIIAREFGFDRSKIVIIHEVLTYEINRHRQLRKTGTTPRKALFNAWDWNYIVFNIKGNVTMGWEMHDGELQQYRA